MAPEDCSRMTCAAPENCGAQGTYIPVGRCCPVCRPRECQTRCLRDTDGPVCGVDGNSYSSACQAECIGVKYERGACAIDACPDKVPSELQGYVR